MATLEIRSGSKAGQLFEFSKHETVVGRYPFCSIVLDDHSISRQHTRFVRDGDGHYVEDMGSLNGTFVNGQRIEIRTQLQDQDRVHVYETLIVFHETDLPPAEPVEATAAEEEKATPPSDTVRILPEQIVNTLDAAAGPSIDANSREKLRAVLEITRSLGSTLDVGEVLPKILDALFEVFPQSDRGYIMFPDDGGELALRDVRSRGDESTTSATLGPISHTVADQVMTQGQAILSTDAFREIDMSESVLDSPIRSMMCAPLMGPARKPLGIVYLDTNDPNHRFFEDDLEVMLSVATVAGQAIEYARQHEAQVELDRRERDLALAQQVQLHLLPQETPALEGYSFCDFYRSVEEVGGDYYGFTRMPDGRLAVSVADVAGKGVPAALLMARLCSDVRYCLVTERSCADAITRLNHELTDPERDPHFITFCLCVLDPQEHRVTIVNAGHMAPLLRRAETSEVVELGDNTCGMPLGIKNSLTYQQCDVTLDPGDSVILYTDGVSEAFNSSQQDYGATRLRHVISAAPAKPDDLMQHILADMNHFLEGSPQSDDICLVCFARNSD